MVDTTKFDQLRVGLASPEEIRKWSKGEVRKPETINYRTFKPEPDGLFCERIFGPTRDWECHCGKYRKIKFRGITCDRCGVEVTRAKVRRERMGHIELAAPVSHIWYLKGVPSPMGLLLDISPRPLERVLYFASHIVTRVDPALLSKSAGAIKETAERAKAAVEQETAEIVEGMEEQLREEAGEEEEMDEAQLATAVEQRRAEERRLAEDRKRELDEALRLLLGPKLDANPGLTKKQLISESEYRALQKLVEALVEQRGKQFAQLFEAGLGAKAIHDLLAEIDLEALYRQLRQEIKETGGPKRARAIKRLEVADAFRRSKNRPEWMILEVVPVIPPELRPMVQLDGGRFATSDLNDLYRRIINRNNRLKKIKELRAPESIINHEKRLLQEAVDALIDNGRRSRPVTGSNNRPLKSLSDMLKGKEGRFRKNLLGKRVDYSGRSVIVVGPHLKLHQCGLPKEMALELFKPFVMKRLVEKGHTTNVKTAKKMVDRLRTEVWDALEEVIKDHPVLLNRAPTLHRLGVQAFEPVLVDGKAIQIHPLVCFAFGADFDGDQMAVHIPLSTAAQAEARVLMLSTENLFSPAAGNPVVHPTRDIILGCYYLTQKRVGAQGAGREFANPEEAMLAHEMGYVDLHADVKVRVDGAVANTTVGRLIFNEALPPKLRYMDRVADEKEMKRLIRDCHLYYGTARTVELVDTLKDLGFRYSTVAGITISMTDMDIPRARREEIIARTEEEVRRTNENYSRGLITAGERADTVCRLWNQASDDVSKAILSNIDPFNPIFMMANSGARGTPRQISQIAGMRGLMSDPFGRFIEDLPIKSNFHEGLSVLEYFVSTHGARKGLADTALRTADAGYLTRRLVDVAQDVIVRAADCGTVEGIEVGTIRDGTEEIEPLEQRIDGRIVPQDLIDPRTDKVLLRAGREIGLNTDGPCPECEGALETVFQCQSCSRVIGESELIDELTARHEAERKAARQAAQVELEARVAQAAASADEATRLAQAIGSAESAVAAEPEGEGIAGEAETAAAVPGTAPPFLAEEEEAEEAGQLIVPLGELEEAGCPTCGGQLDRLKACADCDAAFPPESLTPPLVSIRQAVEACETFLEGVRRLRVGQPARTTIVNPFDNEALIEAGRAVRQKDYAAAHKLADKLRAKGGLAEGRVLVRSPLTCERRQGICAACYGRDLATRRRVEVGEAVGIIAAQSIGEPGTQLTMRTFHTGGVAAQYLTGVAEVKKKRQETLRELHEDIRKGLVDLEAEGVVAERERVKKIQQMLKVLEEQVKGLLRVVELFEARRPKGQAIISEVDGVVVAIDTTGVKRVIIHSDQPLDPPEVLVGEIAAATVRHPRTKEVIVDAGKELTPAVIGKLRAARLKTVKIQKRHLVPYRGYLKVEEGDVLQRGDSLTEGPLDPQKVLAMKGVRGVQDYLVREIQAVYRSQGVDINDKHIEVIVRQMLRKAKITEPGDTILLPGKIYDRFRFDDVNREIVSHKDKPAEAERVLLGITEASLATESWLSAASFQKTTRVLTEAAINGKIDGLVGLKENVIIGRLIPAGTGLERYRSLRVSGPPGEKAFYAAAARAQRDLLASMRSMGEIGEDLGEDFGAPGLSGLVDLVVGEGPESEGDHEDTAI